ncbi:hypothetical protein B1748_21840 [Paenibacillus sp. MY03]|uniref:hypothetical protein n=1 Tax=Paenibacillus sp. MY03 TaxID=302980 RepID=UPI000B3CBF4A|nr:hypothetical protein [Paenibacillus sp. MY03]OUS73987.1 hypothetical protein B1748_21840 [Paenibacillus sp. MY03]
MQEKTSVIVVTDMYHPAQDPGDNFDILTAYSLPEIDLLAVILDVTEKFRSPYANDNNPMFRDMRGLGRDPGIVPMSQLNYIYNRKIPFAPGPFVPMKGPDDKMENTPAYGQGGICLMLETLRRAAGQVEVLSFGSARTIAAAYNREPDLMLEKVRRVHLSAGSSDPGFLEWNVLLDPNAIRCLLDSRLPVALYPCATGDGPFAYGRHNSFWLLPNLSFVRDMQPRLRRYLTFAFLHESRMDFLRAVEEEATSEQLAELDGISHNVWETAIWAEVSGRALVRRADGSYRLLPRTLCEQGDTVLPGELVPCTAIVYDNGAYEVKLNGKARGSLPQRWLYERGDPHENEAALREALPALYRSFDICSLKE